MAASKPFVPVVAVLNMKGGVGKTTLSAHVFRVLFERKRVGTLLIDLDPQFNLTQALFTRARYDEIKSKGNTLSSVMEAGPNLGLFVVKTSAQPIPDPMALGHSFLHFPGAEPPEKLTIIPGDFGLVKFSLMDDNKKLQAAKMRLFKFIEKAKEQYKVIVLDCNPSSSFLTLCALQVCTHILVPVRPDRYSILGLEILSDFVDGLPTISPKPNFIVAINGVPRGKSPNAAAIEAQLRGHPVFGTKTLGNVIRHSGHLVAKPDYTGFASDRRGAWTGILKGELAIFADELAGRIGIK